MIRALALAAALAVPGALAASPCRQALALGLDVSGSVDAREYRQQLDGLAGALGQPEVRAALLSLPGHPVEILVYEWSGPGDQALLAPWTRIEGEAVLDRLIATLAATERRETSPGTGLGVAMTVGAGYLDQRKECQKRTLDISGDGKSNLGPRPRDVKARIGSGGITVNALVIGADNPSIDDTRQTEIGELSSYFKAEVITGPDAFVETALGFEDYEAAMTRKLLRELETLIVSDAGPRQ